MPKFDREDLDETPGVVATPATLLAEALIDVGATVLRAIDFLGGIRDSSGGD